MHSADRPDQARRLAGVDQALGDGRAREPADLLDQLRERLDRLAANHPSATDDPSARPAVEQAVEQSAETGEHPQIADDRERGEPPDDSADVGASRSDEPRRPGRIAAPSAGGVPAEVVGLIGIDRTENEPYRPWFASDDGEPWFVR